MFSNLKRESDLSKIAEAISKVDGAVVAILFGSRARGDYDEYSDYDVLVVFESDEALWENWDDFHKRISETDLFVQASARSIREVREETEPTFLREVLKHGRIIYSRYPIDFPASTRGLRPMRIIQYSMENLSPGDKQKLCYRLFGKKNKKYPQIGMVEELEGERLGSGCVMIPEENHGQLIEILDNYGIEYESKIIHISEEE